MDKIIVVIGICFSYVALSKLIGLYRKNSIINKNDLFLGIIISILAVETIERFTLGLLFKFLGKNYYCIFIGLLLDALVIGTALRKPVKVLTPREKLIGNLELLFCLAFFSWYFMYYLCK